MRITLQHLVLLVLCIASLNACRKEDVVPEAIPPSTAPTSLYSGESIKANFTGYVRDTQGAGIAGAAVSIGNREAITDLEGQFVLWQVDVDSQRAYAEVSQAGFFTGSRVLIPTNNGMNHVNVQLMPDNVTGMVSTDTGGTVSHVSGATVSLPANGIVDATGASYSGEVEVSMAHIDPTAEGWDEQMPGDLTALDGAGDFGILRSYSMMAVELHSPGGELLQLADGAMATLDFPIASSQLADAPETIALWYFDEGLGVWMEEGEATIVDGSYVGDVAHFTFWNCDTFDHVIMLEGSVEASGMGPSAGVAVQVVLLDVTGLSAADVTDANGQYGGYVPANVPMEISYISPCGELLHSELIAPSPIDITMPTVVIPESYATSVSGIALDCSGEVITNGYMTMTGSTYESTQISDDGNFEFVFAHCDEISGYVQAHSATWESDPIYFASSGEDVDLGVISFEGICPLYVHGDAQACDGQPLSNGYLVVQVGDESPVSYDVPADGGFSQNIYLSEGQSQEVTVWIMDGTGQWSSGQMVNSVEPGTMIDLGVLNACEAYTDDYFLVTVDGETDIYFACDYSQDEAVDGWEGFYNQSISYQSSYESNEGIHELNLRFGTSYLGAQFQLGADAGQGGFFGYNRSLLSPDLSLTQEILGVMTQHNPTDEVVLDLTSLPTEQGEVVEGTFTGLVTQSFGQTSGGTELNQLSVSGHFRGHW